MTVSRSYRSRTTTALAVLSLGAATAPFAGFAEYAASSVAFGGDATLGGKGLIVQARPRTSTLKALDVRFTSGAEIRLSAAAKARRYATYTGDIGTAQQYFGTLEIPAHKASGTFRLWFRAVRGQRSKSVTATLTTGARPALHVSGFPTGTTRFALSTVGAGATATRTTSCSGKLARYHGTMTLRLRSGAKEAGRASGEVSCATLPPASDKRGAANGS